MIKFFVIIAIIIGVCVAGIGAYLAPDDLAHCDVHPSSSGACQKADVIVAVSGGNTSVRAAEAIRLFKDGWAERLIFSGAAQDTSGPSNAQVMMQQAIAAGVPSANIEIDEVSKTTHQNAEGTDQLIKNNNYSRIIVVTSPYHQRRAGLEFKDIFGSSVTIINHPADNDPDWPWYWWATPRGWWLAGGELIKIGVVHTGESQ